MKKVSRLAYTCRIVIALLVVASALAIQTQGFSDYTYESARRTAVEQQPVILSDWSLENDQGETLNLSFFQDQLVLVDFIFTRCPTVCRSLGSRYQQLQSFINERQIENVQLLSISIDPNYDTPSKLERYRKAHGAQTDRWHIVRPTSTEVLTRIKNETGLRVIADTNWGFAHSDSVHIIHSSSLQSILDWDSTDLESLILSQDTRSTL